jgi:hypothetical protein
MKLKQMGEHCFYNFFGRLFWKVLYRAWVKNGGIKEAKLFMIDLSLNII